MQTFSSCSLRPLCVLLVFILLIFITIYFYLRRFFLFTVLFPPHSSESSYWLSFQYQQLPLAEHGEL